MSSARTSAAPSAAPAPRYSRAPDGSGVAAAVRRRWPSAVGAAAALASVALVLPLSEPVRAGVAAWSLLVAAVVYLTWGTARGDLGHRRWLAAQTASVVAFGAIALVTVAVDPAVGRYVLAAGWLGHAAWDVFHHRADRVVPRWYAESCMVIDLSVAAVLLTVGFI